jgi:hypothetical protein
MSGIMQTAKLISAITEFPQPYPTLPYSGYVLSGITAPPIEFATVWAARADPEKPGVASIRNICVENCMRS